MIIELGSKVRDRVTGFEGIATSRTVHISGCNTYWVTPGLGKDGKLGEIQSFDEPRLEVLKDKPIMIERGTISAG